MNLNECKIKIEQLSAMLDKQIKNYNLAIDENAGYEVRKGLRNEMRRIGEEIIALKKVARGMDRT